MGRDNIEELKRRLPTIESSVHLTRKTDSESCGPCPLCGGGEDRFIYFAEKKKFWCRQCDKSGDVVDLHCFLKGTDIKGLLKEFGLTGKNGDGYSAGKRVQKKSNSEAKNPEFVKDSVPRWERGLKTDPDKSHVKYLKKRKIYEALPFLKKHKLIGFEQLLVLFPGYDYSGNLIALQRKPMREGSNALYTNRSDGKNALFVLPGDPDGPTIITEGPIDAISAHLVSGCRAIATYSASTVDKLKPMEIKDPVLAFDNDDAGHAATKKALEILPNSRTIDFSILNDQIGKVGIKDLNDLLMLGRADLIKQLFDVAKRPPGASAARKPFSFVLASDMTLTGPEYIVDQIIEEKVMAELAADAGSFKTFIALDLLYHVVTGKPWNGKDVKQSSALMIVGEAMTGIVRRLRGSELHYGTPLKGLPLGISTRAAQLTVEEDAKAVAEAIKAFAKQYGKPGLIVVDTLNRNFGPSDENSTLDMTTFINLVDTYVAPETAVLFVHHMGHSVKTRSRGSSAFFGALDASYMLTKDRTRDRFVTMSCRKMKDSENPPDMNFEMQEVDIGIVDKKGRRVTTLVPILRSTGKPMAPEPIKGDEMKKAYDTLNAMYEEQQRNLEEGGLNPAQAKVLRKDWRKKCISAGIYSSDDTFNRAVRSLITKKRIVEMGPHVLIDSNENISECYD